VTAAIALTAYPVGPVVEAGIQRIATLCSSSASWAAKTAPKPGSGP
jgi:hypothetical protein